MNPIEIVFSTQLTYKDTTYYFPKGLFKILNYNRKEKYFLY